MAFFKKKYFLFENLEMSELDSIIPTFLYIHLYGFYLNQNEDVKEHFPWCGILM